MRKFNINVNGKTYAVEVEETTDGAISSVSAPVQIAAPKAAPAAATICKGEQVRSQMPGLVKKLCFANGTTVKAGDTIIILEAMKMDTPISAPVAGVITYATSEGSNIDSGAVLCTIA